MKTISKLITAALLVAFTGSALAEVTVKAGPRKGRILEIENQQAEFLITKDKKVEVRFLDDAGKVVAPAAQTVTVTMGDRAAPTKLAFTKDGDKFVSDKVIPEGKELPVVLQIKVTPEAKSVTAKFNLNLAKCPTCENAEYACTCAHGGDEKGHEGHDHKPGEKH